MTATAYLESLGYEVEETRGNLYDVASAMGFRWDGLTQLTEFQLEVFAKEVGWVPETPEEKP